MNTVQILLHEPLVITDGNKRRQAIEALEERIGTVPLRMRLYPAMGEYEFDLLKTYGCTFTSPSGKRTRAGCLDCVLTPERVLDLVAKLWEQHIVRGWQGESHSPHYFVALGIVQAICSKYEIYIR